MPAKSSVEHLRGNHDCTGAFRALLTEIAPSYPERLDAGHQTAAVRGFVNMPNQIRQPLGDGWALVGDAAYFHDAITGHGITDAFRDTELLARTLGPVLSGDADERGAMSRYHARRDELIAELFDITSALALYPPVAGFLAALPPITSHDAQAA